MSDNKKWLKLGVVKKGKKDNNYVTFGSPNSKYEPVNVTITVKDLSGTVLAEVTNPNLQCNNPRKRPGITEEQAAKVPEYILAELVLPPQS